MKGARWTYQLDLVVASTEIEVLAKGDSQVEGLGQLAFVMDERNLGQALGMAPVGPTAYVAADGFLCRYTGLDYIQADHLKMLGAEDPTRVIPLGAAPGTEWTNETRLLEQPEGGGGLIKWTGRTKRAESVTVPAGKFSDVILVETEYWDPSIDADHPLIAYQDWYARGVGLLRSVTTNAREGGKRMAEQSLESYEFPPLEAAAR
ncbi:MAG TPA: hypothetical protein VMS55_06410 [Myxococcota bacterium]|nr:hypothetical protein [Myxococcota bacterium]